MCTAGESEVDLQPNAHESASASAETADNAALPDDAATAQFSRGLAEEQRTSQQPHISSEVVSPSAINCLEQPDSDQNVPDTAAEAADATLSIGGEARERVDDPQAAFNNAGDPAQHLPSEEAEALTGTGPADQDATVSADEAAPAPVSGEDAITQQLKSDQDVLLVVHVDHDSEQISDSVPESAVPASEPSANSQTSEAAPDCVDASGTAPPPDNALLAGPAAADEDDEVLLLAMVPPGEALATAAERDADGADWPRMEDLAADNLLMALIASAEDDDPAQPLVKQTAPVSEPTAGIEGSCTDPRDSAEPSATAKVVNKHDEDSTQLPEQEPISRTMAASTPLDGEMEPREALPADTGASSTDTMSAQAADSTAGSDARIEADRLLSEDVAPAEASEVPAAEGMDEYAGAEPSEGELVPEAGLAAPLCIRTGADNGDSVSNGMEVQPAGGELGLNGSSSGGVPELEARQPDGEPREVVLPDGSNAAAVLLCDPTPDVALGDASPSSQPCAVEPPVEDSSPAETPGCDEATEQAAQPSSSSKAAATAETCRPEPAVGQEVDAVEQAGNTSSPSCRDSIILPAEDELHRSNEPGDDSHTIAGDSDTVAEAADSQCATA